METVSLRKPELIEDFDSSHFDQVFVRSKAVVSRRIAGETLIVPVRCKVGDLSSIYSFNATGSLIWQSLESPKSLAELIAIVEREFAVHHQQAEQDVKQFLHDILAADLVEARQEVSMAAMNSSARRSAIAKLTLRSYARNADDQEDHGPGERQS
jgi:hypothetical protein